MDWDLAIERNRGRLLYFVTELFALIGLSEGVAVERVSKSVYRFALSILRPAESAVRRLIFVAARNIVLELPAERPARARPKISTKDKAGGEAKAEIKATTQNKRGASFNLFDPLLDPDRSFRRRPKRRKPNPRITFFDYDPRIPGFLRGQAPPPAPAPEVKEPIDDDTVDARHLIRRLFAAADALKDIPRQALRLARWRARPKEERRPERWSPLRSGRPPGFRQRQKHEVDEILKECQWLARNVMPPLDDTS